MERCDGCPVKEKIALYKKAAVNTVLALELARKQKIGEDELATHFDRTAEQLLIGCKSKILCKLYSKGEVL